MLLEIDFIPQCYNGNMDLICEINDQKVVTWTSAVPNRAQKIVAKCQADICQSFKVKLILQGKDRSKDTKLTNNIIVQDKCIEITRLALDSINITHALLVHDFITENGDLISGSTYFGQNGSMCLTVDPNIFDWIQHCELKLSKNGS